MALHALVEGNVLMRAALALSSLVAALAACSLLYPLDGYQGPAPADAGGGADAGPHDPPALVTVDSQKTLLAVDQAEVRRLALDDTYVYWAAAGPGDAGAFRAEKQPPSTVQPLATNLVGATGISVDVLVHLTTALDPGGAVYEMQPRGAGRRTLAANRAAPSVVATDATAVYWAEGPDVVRTERSGGTPSSVLSTGAAVADIAVRNGAVYAAGEAGVVRASVTGANPCTIDRSPATAIAVDDGAAYWAGADGSIRAGGACGGSVTTLAPEQGTVAAVAVDAQAVYWVTRTPGGVDVRRVAKSGGPLGVIATAQQGSRAQGLAVDDSGVYWAIACCVYKNAKRP